MYLDCRIIYAVVIIHLSYTWHGVYRCKVVLEIAATVIHAVNLLGPGSWLLVGV